MSNTRLFISDPKRIELSKIGTTTRRQNTLEVQEIDYVHADGSVELSADWDIGDGNKILADQIRARNGDGLKLTDDADNGIFVEDGGEVGIGTTTPAEPLDVNGLIKSEGLTIGKWPANSSYVFFGTNALDQSDATNYALLQEAAATPGRTFLNSPIDIKFRIDNADQMIISSLGDIGMGTISPTAKLDVNSDIIRLRTAKTPASASDTGNQGDIAWDSDYIYVCVATNTWKRAALSTW